MVSFSKLFFYYFYSYKYILVDGIVEYFCGCFYVVFFFCGVLNKCLEDGGIDI